MDLEFKTTINRVGDYRSGISSDSELENYDATIEYYLNIECREWGVKTFSYGVKKVTITFEEIIYDDEDEEIERKDRTLVFDDDEYIKMDVSYSEYGEGFQCEEVEILDDKKIRVNFSASI